MDDALLKAIASQVNVDRAMSRILLLADKASDPQGGVSRLAFTSEETEAQEMVAGWMEAAGLTVSFDALGNMYGSTDGNAQGARPVMSGSHLDSVPNGGAYDGVLGVIGAIEAVEAMRAAGARPTHPLEVVVWRCEEAALFGQGRIGSLYFAGELTLDEIESWETEASPVKAYLERAASLPQRAAGRDLAGYLELHIEQGRRLEDRGAGIGAVTAIPGATRWRISIEGRADHSGATPMGLRRDALCAAADLILAVEEAGMEERSFESVATSAAIRCMPGAWSVVPAWTELLTDIRGIEPASIERALGHVKRTAEEIAARRQASISFETATQGTPVRLNDRCVSTVEATARSLGHSAIRMPSGAGHDAQTISPYAPAGMVFIPSRDGVSHSPEEFSKPEQISAGIQVLAGSWATLAS